MTLIQLMASITMVLSVILIYISAKDRSTAGIVFGLLMFVLNALNFLHG